MEPQALSGQSAIQGVGGFVSGKFRPVDLPRSERRIPAMFARNQSVPRLVSLSPIMKRIVLNRLGTLVVVSVLNLQLSTALAQDAAFTPLTITNPTPTGSGFFASATAAAGTDRVLLGARGDDIGASSAGAVYLFSLEPLAPGVPSLTLQLLATNSVAVSWPSPSSG